jgi:hypothetical protein
MNEPFAMAPSVRPGPVTAQDYRHKCILLTLRLAPQSVPELYEATGIPMAELEQLVHQLLAHRYIRPLATDITPIRYFRPHALQVIGAKTEAT